MQDAPRESQWDKYFNVDSQTGTGRFVLGIAAFAIVGGFLVWLIG